MRKLYDKFFYIPKHEKIRESVLLARVTVSLILVISCLISMGFTAFAYFSCNVTASNNVIKAANMGTKVSIKIGDKNGSEIGVVTSDYKSHWAELSAGNTYYITVKHNENSEVGTGFMVITAENCGKKYHTQQIAVNDNGESEIIAFTIRPSAATKITFLSHWGTSSLYGDFEQANADIYIEDGETVELAIAGNENSMVVTEGLEGSISVDATKKEPAKDSKENSSANQSSAQISSKPVADESKKDSQDKSENQANSESVTSSDKAQSVESSIDVETNTASTDGVTTKVSNLEDSDSETENNNSDAVTKENVVIE